ncbi:hypothetical protein M426DRAFT_260579 [Hypoxylon sp. CI-4A]|nr:hypothetical protein M426DRAFT_260579 [Hypoxylon sp. CI-4A]
MDASQSLNWTLINEMAAALTPEQRAEAEMRMRSSSKLPMDHFQVAIGVLFGLASLAFFGRIAVRVLSRRRIFIDDGFVITSFVCLVAATSIFYKRARIIYMVFSLMRGDEVIELIASQEIADVYGQMNWSFPYVTFMWTTIFMVKLCYFAFFRVLLQSMPKSLIRYYWTAVVMTIVAWMYLVLQQLIICPYFGASSFKCFPTLPVSDTVMNFTFWIGPVLDALTDASIISIPLIILRKSQMALLTKIGLGIFLCLSLFMLACSITRAAGTYYNGTNALDTPWQVFWLHAEACVSVLMASITVYRSVLVGPTKVSGRFQRWLNKALQMRASNEHLDPRTLDMRTRIGWTLLSRIPNATLSGLATLFGGPDHTLDSETNNLTMDSIFELRDTNYHEHLERPQPRELQRDVNESISSPDSM